jgi:hypothetical protein
MTFDTAESLHAPLDEREAAAYIAAETAKIRAGWSETEFRKRTLWSLGRLVTVTEAHDEFRLKDPRVG